MWTVEIWWAYRLFEGAVEPPIVDNILYGDGRILEVLKGVHEDEIKDDVIEVQMFDLIDIEIRNMISLLPYSNHLKLLL